MHLPLFFVRSAIQAVPTPEPNDTPYKTIYTIII
jgi:hypothetical protein